MVMKVLKDNNAEIIKDSSCSCKHDVFREGHYLSMDNIRNNIHSLEVYQKI